jgi:hypothetical protein
MSFSLDRSRLYAQFSEIVGELYEKVDKSSVGKKHTLYFEHGERLHDCRIFWKEETPKRKRKLAQEASIFLGQGSYGQVFTRHREGEKKKVKKIFLRPTLNLIGAIREFFLFNLYHRVPGQTYRLAITVNPDRTLRVRMTLPFLEDIPILKKHREFRGDLVSWLKVFAQGLDRLFEARQYGIALFDVKFDNLIGPSCFPCDFGSALFEEEFSTPGCVIVACPELQFLSKTLGLSPDDPAPSYGDDVYALSLTFLALLGFNLKDYYRLCSAPDADFKVAVGYRERFMDEALKPGLLKANFSPMLTERILEIFRNLIPFQPSALFSLARLPSLSLYFKALCRVHQQLKETSSPGPYARLDEIRFSKSLQKELNSKMQDRKESEGEDLETESDSEEHSRGDEAVLPDPYPPLGGAGGPAEHLVFFRALSPITTPIFDVTVPEAIAADALAMLRASGGGASTHDDWTEQDDDFLAFGTGAL